MKKQKKQRFFEKTKIFGMLAFMIVGMIFSTSIVNAYKGDYLVKGPNYNEERHILMENAFDALDYDSWHDLMTEDGRHPRVAAVVTESNFETFVKAHEAGVNGDYETAFTLRSELGLNNGNGPMDGTGYGKGNGQGRGQRMQKNNFIDLDNDGICDNIGLRQGKGRR